MALEGAQGGDTRDGRERTAVSRPGRDGAAGRTVPETAAHQDPLVDPNGPDAYAVPGIAALPSHAPRQERRSQSFAYDTKALQGENLTYAILTQPSQGWVTNNGDGTFSFDPGLDFRNIKSGETRRISFSYQVSDGWSGTETESVTLTVTGSADGSLTIELAAGNPSRRAARPRSAPLADSAASGGMPPEPPAARATEATGEIKTTGFADDPLGAPVVARSGAETAPPNERSDGAASEGGTPGGESPDTSGPSPDGAATVPAMASQESSPGEAAGSAGLEPGLEIRAPLAYDAGADPFVGDAVPPDNEEVLVAPDLGLGPQVEPENADAEPPVPAEFPLPAEDGTSHTEPHVAEPEPGPVTPEPKPDGEGRRYTILAQPPEGRVSATYDGGFDFTPGADFPDLAVGELEQVSFTCEATDADGAKSIVIASLTVTGTSDGPEVCDVTYRQAQGKDATQSAMPRADNRQPDTASRGAERDPGAGAGAGTGDWPKSTPPDLAMGGEIGGGTPGRDGVAEPSHSEFPTAAGPDGDERADPPGWELTAETPGAAPASPSWQPDPEIGANAFAPGPESTTEPSVDAIAAPDGGEVFAASDPDGRQQDDPAAWDTAAETWPETPPSPTWQANRDDVPKAFGQGSAPAVEPLVDDPAAPVGGETLAEREPYGEQQVEPAAWEPAAETPAEAASPPTWHEDAGTESPNSFHPDPEPATGHSAGDGAPPDSGDPLAMPGRYDEPRTERSATGIAGDHGQSKDDYRGAVAAEAVTTFLPDDSDAVAAGRPDAADLAPEDPGPEPTRADEATPADIEPDPQAAGLDGIFGAADPGEPTGSDDRDASGGDLAAPVGPALDDLPNAELESAAGDAEASQVSDGFVEDVEVPIAAAGDTAAESGLTPVAADEGAAEPAELSDFALSQDTVAEKSEIGTMVGQVLVTGAEPGSRFIFDLQNDAGGRFDINPRTGKITVADGALLDHLAADSHDILVQVIAHSGVSCRKTLTIKVLPTVAGQAVDPPAAPQEATDIPVPEGVDVARGPALRAGNGRDAEPVADGEAYRPDDSVAGGSMVDTLYLDGVSGGPGLGGWALELSEGEIVQTNDDNLMLSENSTGTVILDGCPVKVAFQGVARIEW